ncbi:MAG: hypothetical protein VX772_01590 [Bacteroidota bacterium]|uniref:DUF308 domain-containing protein n=1 Tax=Flagellimonas okinawensis TaxID=3031324 RepID=A0ABT5XM41_9FLAO|nr:hypothetical protein [[Muricauda] okinawensis]MDF0706895.1 hypothetical protein [[Muricauda] okinawensis]MEC8831024.1 hypothetical protein [Bacteroidota bacterium]
MNKEFKEKNGAPMDSFLNAQSELRKGYADGSLGVLASGTVWMVAASAAFLISSKSAIWTLFFGGMLIYPLGLIMAKLMGIRGSHSNQNPLGKLVMEGTIFMLMCIPLALLLSLQNHAWFFQGMLLIIGGRYLTFATLYGIKTYWILGGLLGVSAFALFFLETSPAISALSGSILEIGFGIFMFTSYKRKQR